MSQQSDVGRRVAAVILRMLARLEREHGLAAADLAAGAMEAGILHHLGAKGFPATASFAANTAEGILLKTLTEGVASNGRPH